MLFERGRWGRACRTRGAVRMWTRRAVGRAGGARRTGGLADGSAGAGRQRCSVRGGVLLRAWGEGEGGRRRTERATGRVLHAGRALGMP
jgi:hypothetical protein